MEELERRLRGRGSEKEETLLMRIENAKAELTYGHSGIFDRGLVNRELNLAARELYEQIFEWYPEFLIRLKITAFKSIGFYLRTAQKLIEDADSDCNAIDITGAGKAAGTAASVA